MARIRGRRATWSALAIVLHRTNDETLATDHSQIMDLGDQIKLCVEQYSKLHSNRNRSDEGIHGRKSVILQKKHFKLFGLIYSRY